MLKLIVSSIVSLLRRGASRPQAAIAIDVAPVRAEMSYCGSQVMVSGRRWDDGPVDRRRQTRPRVGNA